ncbi:hypothetical protein TNCT_558041 [Trichonephila clavata]|uniref:Uncharacterized protein n=1 Tax=Trichonephila clavata TaxID=2740835 RepID=A0A8X6GZF4_TRICU|nr:hypothetical protein TNCT_558041 [Trichonephila clavata]
MNTDPDIRSDTLSFSRRVKQDFQKGVLSSPKADRIDRLSYCSPDGRFSCNITSPENPVTRWICPSYDRSFSSSRWEGQKESYWNGCA